MNLALFDFDGTITSKDTLFDFIKFCTGNVKFTYGFSVLFPVMVLYKLKIIPSQKMKEIVLSFFFKGTSESKFKDIAKEYSLTKIDVIVKEKALERLKFHKTNDDKIIVVSASIDCWLQPWCDKNGLELIATKLEFKDGVFTGKFATKNCKGKEKVNRIKKKYNLAEFDKIYAYGDSQGDKEMLAIADESFYKSF